MVTWPPVVDGGTCEKGLNFAPEKVGWEIGWAVSGISQRSIGFLVEKHWLAHGSGYELYEPDVLVVDTLPCLSGLTLAVIVGEIPDAVFHLLVSIGAQVLAFEGGAELSEAEMIILAHGGHLPGARGSTIDPLPLYRLSGTRFNPDPHRYF